MESKAQRLNAVIDGESKEEGVMKILSKIINESSSSDAITKWTTDGNMKEIDRTLMSNNDTVLGFMEIKTRKIAHDRYPTTIIDLYKYLKLKPIMDATGLPVYLGIHWLKDDVYGYYDLSSVDAIPNITFKTEASQFRGKSNNKPVININIKDFILIKNGEIIVDNS